MGDPKDDMPSLRFEPIELLHSEPGYRRYRALDRHLNTVVVVSAGSGDLVDCLSPADFLAVATSLRDADSEALPEIVQFGFHGSRSFVAHTLIAGRSLAALEADQKGAAVAVAAGLFISRGLRPLHAIGRGHGHVELNSLVVRDNGQVLFTEPGLMRAWCSRYDQQPDPAEDILQLGRVMLLLASTGTNKEPAVEAALRALIGDMMARRPEDRPTLDIVDDVLADLDRRLSPSSARAVPSTAKLSRKRRRTGRLVGFQSSPGSAVPQPPAMVEAPRAEAAVSGMSEEQLERMVGGRMAGFINTVSVCSAKWWVGKEHRPWAELFGIVVPPPRKPGPTPAQRASLVMPLLLIAAVALLWWDRSEPELVEPSLMASLAQIAPTSERPAFQLPPDPPIVQEPELAVATPSTTERVVRYRNGKSVDGELDGDRLAELQPVTPYRAPIRRPTR